MNTICTSCGISIPSSSTIYKCHQCVYHFVCESCEKKEHNRACTHFHTLHKIHSSQTQSTTITSAASSTQSKSFDDAQKTQIKTSSISSSIFNSDDFLYNFLSNCSHCHRIIVMNKEPSFQCQQCPQSFGVCAECKPVMITHHPSTHTFSQKSLDDWARLAYGYFHLDVKCDGCSAKHFSGNRRQCEECSSNYDLCDSCFGKIHTEHKMKYIQNPVLYNNNRGALARRTLALAEKSNDGNSNWRDSSTGWTKSDAELVDQEAKQENMIYYNRLQQIRESDAEFARQLLYDAQRRLRNTISDSWNRLTWSTTFHR